MPQPGEGRAGAGGDRGGGVVVVVGTTSQMSWSITPLSCRSQGKVGLVLVVIVVDVLVVVVVVVLLLSGPHQVSWSIAPPPLMPQPGECRAASGGVVVVVVETMLLTKVGWLLVVL